MKATRTLTAAAILAVSAGATAVQAADSAAGQQIFTNTCSVCHKSFKAYAGKSQADLETSIKGIVAGTVKHPKKLALSPDDIANVAAYIASNEPKS